MSDTIISIIMLAAVVLLAGAVFLFRKGQKKQARLMLILSVVMFANVAIWLVPIGEGSQSSGDDGSRGEAAAIER